MELKDHVTEEFLAWCAQYLVMKRASIEHNFHTLYATFIDHLQMKDFLSLVVKETYRNIKVCELLRIHKGRENISFTYSCIDHCDWVRFDRNIEYTAVHLSKSQSYQPRHCGYIREVVFDERAN